MTDSRTVGKTGSLLPSTQQQNNTPRGCYFVVLYFRTSTQWIYLCYTTAMKNNDTVPNCFYRISVKALVLNETRDRFLIVQESNGKWELPGGGLEWGAQPDQDVSRESKEEMTLTQPAWPKLRHISLLFLTIAQERGAPTFSTKLVLNT